MIDSRKLYEFVEIEPDGEKDVSGLAIETHVYDNKEEKCKDLRFVSSRPHSLKGKLLSETDDGFVWQWDREVEMSKLVFKILTLKEFNKKFPYVAAGLPKFKCDEELYEWYRTKYRPSYF